jgi:pyruvate-ferredoxin/flavodoxin oxidoreductase
VLDSGPAKLPVREYMREEARFRITETLNPERYKQLLALAQENVTQRYGVYEQLAKVVVPQTTTIPDVRPPPAATLE